MSKGHGAEGRPREGLPERMTSRSDAGLDPSSRNDLSGVVHGSAVQAGSIEGGVHFSVMQAAHVSLPTPAQLPPAPAHFTGRTRELATLNRLACGDDPVRGVTLLVISGVGGVGKTALVSHWLHSIKDQYKDGALFADLSGHLPGAAARPSDVLARFLRALGTPPEQIPLELSEQTALYRSATSGRRMTVFLDNAASAAQVRTLLPGPASSAAHGETRSPRYSPTLVVATTRWRIGGLAMDGAHFIELGPLDEPSAAELFGHIVGSARAHAEPAAALSVISSCARLPLAVCVAAARLASHANWPVSRVAEELASERRRLQALSITGDLSVRAVFDVSYQVLPPPAARSYRLLALLPGTDFCSELASAALAEDGEYTDDLLDTLTGASLLEETTSRRFRFHDLVKLHAREKADTESGTERKAVITRAVDWYLKAAVQADLVILPGRWRLNPMYERARASPKAYPSPAAALEWLESELSGLLLSVRSAQDEGLHEKAWQLCEALWGLFGYRKYFRYWIETHLTGLVSAQACGDGRAESRMRVQLGHAYLNLGRIDEAHVEFTQALALSRAERHRLGEATALEQLGLIDLKMGRPGNAITTFMQARDIFTEVGRPRGVANMTRHLAEAHRDAGRHDQAARDFREARRLAAHLPDPYSEARCLTGLGQTYLSAGQISNAAAALCEALTITTGLGARYEQARIRVLLAEASQRRGDVGQARRNLRLALTIYSRVGAPEADDVRRRLRKIA